MADYIADLRDIKFALFEQLDWAPLLKSERFADFSLDDFEMMLGEAHRLAREVFGPANEAIDRQGATLADGKVTLPEAIREPLRQLIDGGWIGLSHSPEYGGQGAPETIRKGVDSIFFGACVTLQLGVLLTNGAARLIENFGSEELRKLYCEKMYTSEWAGTMCLTEAGAGSDVGALTTKAKRAGDHFLIEGEKIFITFGDHDATDNIIHAVLARIEGAPAGTKGISLFVVPKFRLDADGKSGEPNDVLCVGLEHKLGIHGSPTCTMSFGSNGDCHGWLIGAENGGMRAMFQMMNEARISVGMQGVSLGAAAYQGALKYCQERLQGPHYTRLRDGDAPRVPIIEHPDVRVMLLRQKAYVEGMRAMIFFAAYCIDRAETTADDKERENWEALVDILTPICKAYGSDMGFRVTEWALQCYGGYGYLKDFPVEQHMRDVKIASLYEGTNGIQALDLIGRKLMLRGGACPKALHQLIARLLEQHKQHPVLAPQVAALAKATEKWGALTMELGASAAKGEMTGALMGATMYLSLCGDLVTAYFLLDQAVAAHAKLATLCQDKGVDIADAAALRALVQKDAEACFLDGKIKTARFFCANELPQVHSKAAAIRTADTSPLDITWAEI